MQYYTYLALGDSYTIGECVSQEFSFPAQLVGALEKQGYQMDAPKIIATTGWTTDELMAGIEAEKPGSDYDLVSLLIGVNNQYRGYPQEQYLKEFRQLLEKAIGFAGGKSSHVFVVAIPDYGCTPFGKEKADQIFEELCWYNETGRSIAAHYGIAFCDIFPVSRLAAKRPELTASDDLHPSAAMYSRWVEIILPHAISCLSRDAA